jgi:hypothetical protein
MEQYVADGGERNFPLHSVVISDNNLKHFFYCHKEWRGGVMCNVFALDVFIPSLNSCYRYYWVDNGTMELFHHNSNNDKYMRCVFVISEHQANLVRAYHDYAVKINQYITK